MIRDLPSKRIINLSCGYFPLKTNSRLTKWRLRLEEYNYEVHYKKGRENVVADALSRVEINQNDINVLTRKQTTSCDNNGTSDLISILPNVYEQDILSPETLDQILDSTSLDDDVPLAQLFRKQSEKTPDSNATVHTAIENPIFTLPITEKPLQSFSNCFILQYGDKTDYHREELDTKHKFYRVTINEVRQKPLQTPIPRSFNST